MSSTREKPLSHNVAIGRAGEEAAAVWLVDRGFRILDRNWRCSGGELDIVAWEADTLVFVEVKARTGASAGHPLEAVTERKIARLRRLAAAWCATHPDVRSRLLRLDVVSVLLRPGCAPVLEHVQDCS